MSLGDEGTDVGGAGQTRTRLPGGDGGVYGSPRRPARSSSRSLVTVVGVIVLLIAAIAFANRGGDGGSAGKETRAGGPGAAAPTAPTGKNPVSSGFAHDRQGAESAAANYAVALVSADILKPALRPDIVQSVFVTDKVSGLQAKLDKAYDRAFLEKVGLDESGNAPRGKTYVSRTAPIGSKVTSYADNNSATVEVWCTGVFGMAGEDSTNPVTSDWFTMTLKMRWTDGDWKVESFSQKEGPAPVNGDNRASTADDIAKAVEQYGGFTYAR
ncbi:hypothetical protein [Streptomyces sp. NPDC002851]